MISKPKTDPSRSTRRPRIGHKFAALIATLCFLQPLATNLHGQECESPNNFDPTHFVRIGGANWYIEITDNGYSDILIDTRLGFISLSLVS